MMSSPPDSLAQSVDVNTIQPAFGPKAQSPHPLLTYEGFTFLSTVVYLTYAAMEGMFRYIFVSIGLPMGTYFSLFFIMISGSWWIIRGIRNFPTVGTFCLVMMLFHIFVGICVSPDIRQPLMGIRMFMNVFCSAAIAPHLFSQRRNTQLLLVIIYALCVLGVAINGAFGQMPWNKVEIDVGGLKLTGSGVDLAGDGSYRAAGFSRDHQIVAGIVASISLMFMIRIRNVFLGLALAVVTFATVWETNSKTQILTLLIIVPPVLLLRGRWRGLVLKGLLIFFCAAAYLCPIVLANAHFEMPNTGSSLYSFIDRVDNSWPDTWAFFFRDGYGILGVGIGGIGTPQRLFTTHSTFPIPDNGVLYFWGWFGVLGLFYLLAMLILVLRHRADDIETQAGLASMCYGMAFIISNSIVEDPLTAMFLFGPFFAIVVGPLATPRRRQDMRPQWRFASSPVPPAPPVPPRQGA